MLPAKGHAMMFDSLAKKNLIEIAKDLDAVKEELRGEIRWLAATPHNLSPSKCKTRGHVRTKSEQNLCKRPSKLLQLDKKLGSNPELEEGSTKGTTEGDADDRIAKDREDLVKFNVEYVRMNGKIPPTAVEQYKFVKMIGRGAFGKVILGIHKLTGKYVAIKTIERSHMRDAASRKKVFREVRILERIQHANVIRLLEVFESAMHLLIVTEYAGGGDLQQLVKRRKRIPEPEAKDIFRQVVYGLAHIHARSILHRDIKLDNVLLDSDGTHVKICDFGVSLPLDDKTAVLTEQCGTPAYIAPEVISGEVFIPA